MKTRNCLFCKLHIAAVKESMGFLNWFAERDPKQWALITDEYMKYTRNKNAIVEEGEE